MSNKKRTGRPSKYPLEFQRDAVAMVLDDGRSEPCSQIGFAAFDTVGGVAAEAIDVCSTLATASGRCVTDRCSQGHDTVGSLSHAPTAMAAEFDIGSGHHYLAEMKPFPNDRLAHLHHHDAGFRRGDDHRLTQSLQAAFGYLAHCDAVSHGEKFSTAIDLGRMGDGVRSHDRNVAEPGCLDKSA